MEFEDALTGEPTWIGVRVVDDILVLAASLRSGAEVEVAMDADRAAQLSVELENARLQLASP